MKNNINYKKYILFSLIVSILFSVMFYFFNDITYKNYSYNYNLEVEKLLTIVKKNNPDIDTNEIIKELRDTSSDSTFESYGINISDKSIIEVNNKRHKRNILECLCLFLISSICSILIFIRYTYKKEKEINKITNVIKEINKKNRIPYGPDSNVQWT